ncbi:hypothetical protein [Flavobacterium sp.]|uniref:hypothetical protein n=1 Tax=Flavobacterium sp. TaxID=239 RepID=UPI002B4B07B3|nr:hypothetical protein [Flavobacterium sp.]HLP65136.1 hypothetical protein [Flavobacterium sp.]
MFKNIQKYLLINHPILWNTKVVPATVILLVLNLIFFLLGLSEGKLDFNETENDYNFGIEGTVIFFGVLISIVFIVVWLVYYLKNNSFKSFYPKSNFSLFKEWMILFLVCFLTTLFSLSFYLGKDVRIRSYYSEAEAKKRCEILSMGSYFVDGSYSNNEYRNYEEAKAIEAPVDTVDDSRITFNNREYSYFSLINKNLNSYPFFDFNTDSIRERKIRLWLVNQQKDSIKKVFKDYLSIAKEHNLKSNIDENKWFELINDYPDFENHKLIGGDNDGAIYYIGNYQNTAFDSVNKYLKVINKDETKEFYRYYVPEKRLNYNYDKISDSWVNPTFRMETLLISLYLGLGLSLLIFAFRVTSGRNWLITVIGLGVINIVIGIIAAICREDLVYPTLLLLIGLSSMIYFFVTLSRKKSKNISAIFLNSMLWILPAMLPILYFMIQEILNDMARNDISTTEYIKNPYHLMAKQMDDFAPYFFYLNLGFMVLMMLLLSFKIKKWRGLAEG